MSDDDSQSASPAQGLANTCQVVPTVPQCVVFDYELRSDRCAVAQREGCSLVQLVIGERAHCRRGLTAVLPQEFERGGFADACLLLGVLAIQLSDHVPCNFCDSLAAGDGSRDLNLDRIDAGDVMHDDTDRAAGLSAFGERGAPLREPLFVSISLVIALIFVVLLSEML